MKINVDLHYHSGASGGVGKINLTDFLNIAPLKGIDVVGSGDCLCPVSQGGRPSWLETLKKSFQEGESDFGGRIPVNTDGGLLSCGHPFGGTGIRQAIEIMHQLRGDATRQVEGARTGLTHNLSGFIAAHTVVIYGREP